jgi:hypothetical protein
MLSLHQGARPQLTHRRQRGAQPDVLVLEVFVNGVHGVHYGPSYL